MCDKKDENSCRCLTDILNIIVCLQRKDEQVSMPDGCDKPFLGPCPSLVCYNTRPVSFYNCCNGDLWTLPYTIPGCTSTANSSVFRVENVDDCCCTCRVLAPNHDVTQVATSPYILTDSYFTIDLNCVAALRCLPDVYVPCA